MLQHNMAQLPSTTCCNMAQLPTTTCCNTAASGAAPTLSAFGRALVYRRTAALCSTVHTRVKAPTGSAEWKVSAGIGRAAKWLFGEVIGCLALLHDAQ